MPKIYSQTDLRKTTVGKTENDIWFGGSPQYHSVLNWWLTHANNVRGLGGSNCFRTLEMVGEFVVAARETLVEVEK
jgi:hypothetical protein